MRCLNADKNTDDPLCRRLATSIGEGPVHFVGLTFMPSGLRRRAGGTEASNVWRVKGDPNQRRYLAGKRGKCANISIYKISMVLNVHINHKAYITDRRKKKIFSSA